MGSARGRLITIEGIDGAGKTTLARGLVNALEERGIDAQLLREPGGVELAERLRTLLKDPSLSVSARAEALLYAASRAQLVEEAVLPRLEAGAWVLLDRFVDSSLAYQGGGRGLGIETIAELNRFAIPGLVPDRTLLVSLPVAEGLRRASARSPDGDRLEHAGEDFFERASDAYRQLREACPGRIRELDGSSSPEDVLGAALRELEDLL